LNRVLEVVAEVSGRAIRLRREPRQKGDVRHTAADVSRARADLGYLPTVGLREGLARQWEWIRELYS
jgi:UDP-glucose 4-epimerase